MAENTDGPDADGLWVTVGQLAEMKGISHPAHESVFGQEVATYP